jgi:hypothetical protein
MHMVSGAESAGNGDVSRKVLIVDISDFENRKHEIAKQLHYAASEVGFVSPYRALQSVTASHVTPGMSHGKGHVHA